MDTRSKILTLESAMALSPPRPLVIVAGLFDILRAPHARDLAEARRRAQARTLVAVVFTDEQAVAGDRARVELVAALRVIDYVIAAHETDLDRLAAKLEPAAIVRLEAADRERVRELIAHVHRRQTC